MSSVTFMPSCQTQRCLKHIIVSVVLLITLYCIYIQWPHYTIPSYVPKSVLTRCEKLCPYVSKFGRNRLWFNSSHSIRHFPDFVCPQNFRNLADWVYGWPNRFFENVEKITTDGKEIAPCLPPGSIIY